MSARIPASAWEISVGRNPGGPYVTASILTDKGFLVSVPMNYDKSPERAIRAAKQACRNWMSAFGAKYKEPMA